MGTKPKIFNDCIDYSEDASCGLSGTVQYRYNVL